MPSSALQSWLQREPPFCRPYFCKSEFPYNATLRWRPRVNTPKTSPKHPRRCVISPHMLRESKTFGLKTAVDDRLHIDATFVLFRNIVLSGIHWEASLCPSSGPCTRGHRNRTPWLTHLARHLKKRSGAIFPQLAPHTDTRHVAPHVCFGSYCRTTKDAPDACLNQIPGISVAVLPHAT